MRIDYLADHPSLVPALAQLHFEQWGHLRPYKPLESRTRRHKASYGRCVLPSVVLALEQSALAGSAMLITSDMDTRPDLTPWLAGVYVVAGHRGRGVGSALVTRVEAEASALGVARLYLYTPDAMAFYARLGWAAEERCEYLGQAVTIMSKRP